MWSFNIDKEKKELYAGIMIKCQLCSMNFASDENLLYVIMNFDEQWLPEKVPI
jgi:hypothetical protein